MALEADSAEKPPRPRPDVPPLVRISESQMAMSQSSRSAQAASELSSPIRLDPTTIPLSSEKERRTNIRQIRSNLNYGNVPGLLEYLQSCTDPKVQVTLLEALGWHGHAWNAGEIAKVAESMASDDALPEEVRSEAMKTYKRITE